MSTVLPSFEENTVFDDNLNQPTQRSRLIAPRSSCAFTRMWRSVESRCVVEQLLDLAQFAPALRSSEAKIWRSV